MLPVILASFIIATSFSCWYQELCLHFRCFQHLQCQCRYSHLVSFLAFLQLVYSKVSLKYAFWFEVLLVLSILESEQQIFNRIKRTCLIALLFLWPFYLSGVCLSLIGVWYHGSMDKLMVIGLDVYRSHGSMCSVCGALWGDIGGV